MEAVPEAESTIDVRFDRCPKCGEVRVNEETLAIGAKTPVHVRYQFHKSSCGHLVVDSFEVWSEPRT